MTRRRGAVIAVYLAVVGAYAFFSHWRLHRGWPDSLELGLLLALSSLASVGVARWRKRRNAGR